MSISLARLAYPFLLMFFTFLLHLEICGASDVCSAVSQRTLSVFSGFGWLGLNTTHFYDRGVFDGCSAVGDVQQLLERP